MIRFHLSLVALIVAVLISLSSFSLLWVHEVQADGGCPTQYTVQYGDTLYSLSQRFNTSVPELMALNQGRIHNPNYILAGQPLCLPGPSEPVTNSLITLEATYQYTPNLSERKWNLTTRGGNIGKRIEYPLEAIDPIDTVSETQEMMMGVITTPAPVLVGVRNDDEANTYTLVTVGREDILSSLRISGTVPLRSRCRVAWAVKDALGDETVQDITVTLWLEGREGLRYPFFVTRVDALPNTDLLERCYTGPGKDDKIGFALFPASSGRADEYHVLMKLTEEGFGPPGRRWRNRCSSWRRSGRFYRWIRAWYGC